MVLNATPPCAQQRDVFIVRVWIDGAAPGAFRAAVQRAGTDESAWFTNSVALARYLEACVCPAADAEGTRVAVTPESRPPE